ncbi:tRNA1(Val) [Gaertneriomyces sp. JEL0708]|nr:tRNA1(Val) [Gaertneriomyces sp. JEL0708]
MSRRTKSKSSPPTTSDSDASPMSPSVGKPKHFTMMREFALADIVTLLNSASGTTSIFASLKYMTTGNEWFLWAAVGLLPAALFFDVIDGRVARWTQSASPMGRELDSLADVISFGVAPAVLGFAVGLQGLFDLLILLYFVNCGVARLARYNTTFDHNVDKSGKISFFEGTPIPTTVFIGLWIGWLIQNGQIGDLALPGGKLVLGGWTLHPMVLIYGLSGTLQISKTIRIPKP